MKYNILVIDDDDQTNTVFTKIVRPRKPEKIEVNPIYFDPSKFKDINDNIDEKAVREAIVELVSNESFIAIATDFSYGDEYITGIDMIKYIKTVKRQHKTPVLLYSSKLTNVIKSIQKKCIEECKEQCSDECKKNCKNNGEQINIAKFSEKMAELINLRIAGFVERGGYPEFFNKTIKKLKGDPSRVVVDKLRQLHDLDFKSMYRDFEGMSFEQIADEIDKESARGLEFQKEMIDICIDTLTDINNV